MALGSAGLLGLAQKGKGLAFSEGLDMELSIVKADAAQFGVKTRTIGDAGKRSCIEIAAPFAMKVRRMAASSACRMAGCL